MAAKRAPKVQTPAQARRAAQRKLSRDLKQGNEILPKQLKNAVNQRTALVNQIFKLKKEIHGDSPKWDDKHGRDNITTHAVTGKNISNAALRKTLDYLERQKALTNSDMTTVRLRRAERELQRIADNDPEIKSVLYYH